jgi:hypothetical protein
MFQSPIFSATLRAMLILTMILVFHCGSAAAQVDLDDSKNFLRKMSDYVGRQSQIAADFNSDIEVVSTDLQKIQFSSSGHVLLSRPDKLRFSRIGGYSSIDLIFDGQVLTVSRCP